MRKVDVKEHARIRELRVLDQWKRDNTFQQSVDNRAGQPNFVFYEGPPTANGKPHIGHVLGRVIKDLIGRYKTMAGYRVVRKAGWDTHGLPVELGVEKELGISGKYEIEEYGVAKFIDKCKNSVFEYEKQWRELTEAIAYWTDMDDPYVTLTNDYIESVWQILSKIHDQGLLYKGHRVSPYCPDCETTLSSHEVAQGYENVKDLSVTAKFRSETSEDIFLAWTTTPWTLPANVALAINKELEYVRVKHDHEIFVVAKNLVDQVIDGHYEILSTHKGSEFVGIPYKPPFAYVGVSKGHIIVEAAGKYKEEIGEFAGRFVKDCDVDIVKSLAERNLLFSKERYEHSYPFCWRCKSPRENVLVSQITFDQIAGMEMATIDDKSIGIFIM